MTRDDLVNMDKVIEDKFKGKLNPNVNMLYPSELYAVLPKHVQNRVTAQVMIDINTAILENKLIEGFKDSLIGFTDILSQGKFKLKDYVKAIQFVCYKLMGDTHKDAYIKTHPGRYAEMLKNGYSTKDICSLASMYARNKIVSLIMERALIPTHLMNAGVYQEAINTQAELMRTAKSEKVRCDAAANLIANLKAPEVTKMQLDVGVKQDRSVIEELYAATEKLAKQQLKSIQCGLTTAINIAQAPLQIECINDEE